MGSFEDRKKKRNYDKLRDESVSKQKEKVNNETQSKKSGKSAKTSIEIKASAKTSQERKKGF